jgi:3-hydroxyacyl-CoA dehydrogenase
MTITTTDHAPPPDAAALSYIEQAERRPWPFSTDAAAVPPLRAVGVIGAGTMGSGIAMNFLNCGLPVTLVDTTQAALDRGLASIRRSYASTVKKGRISESEVAERLGLLRTATAIAELRDCDLVIEAVFESMEVKRAVFSELDRVAKPGAILATNTSYLDVNEIADATKRPEWVVGLHFFSPANIMKLLEIVRGAKTNAAVIDTCVAMARSINKIPVVVGVCYGFVGNRMLAQRRREADRLILEGAMPWDVDRVFTAFGMPMGPFAMSDLAGLDLGWNKEKSAGATVRELLNEMGRHGQKTNAGYYDYDSDRKPHRSAVVETLILEFSAKRGIQRTTVSDQEILQRCLYPMINEGAKILAEKIVASARDIDVVWVNGYGFPRQRGGPMYYADAQGLANVLATLRDFEHRLGADFKPAPLLEQLAASGGKFSGD